MAKPPAANPHDRRMQATAEKLRAALDRLTGGAGEPSDVSTQRLTVAALAREAGVSRNAIYANHRDILDDLARARQRQVSARASRLGLEAGLRLGLALVRVRW